MTTNKDKTKIPIDNRRNQRTNKKHKHRTSTTQQIPKSEINYNRQKGREINTGIDEATKLFYTISKILITKKEIYRKTKMKQENKIE